MHLVSPSCWLAYRAAGSHDVLAERAMDQAVQFVLILGAIAVLVIGAVGVPLLLGMLGAMKLKVMERKVAEVQRRSEERLAEMEERLEFAERILQQQRERGGLPRGESPQ